MSSFWQTNNRLRGTHWLLPPELGEGKKHSLSSGFETVLSETGPSCSTFSCLTCDPNAKGPNLDKKPISLERLKFSSFRLKFSIWLENFNLAWNVQSWPWEFPTKIGVWWVARLKMSISIENFIRFNLAWKFQSRAQVLIIFKIWALWERSWERAPETKNSQKVVRRGCKRSFGPRAPMASGTGAKRELHLCKTRFWCHWCKRHLGDLWSLGPKQLLRPLLTTLGTFEASGPCGRHSGSQCLT